MSLPYYEKFMSDEPFFIWKREKAESSVPHFHRFIELVFFEQCPEVFLCTDEKKIHIKSNKIIVVQPYITHWYQFPDVNCKYIVIGLDPIGLSSFFKNSSLSAKIENFINCIIDLPAVLPIDERLLEIFRDIGTQSVLSRIGSIFSLERLFTADKLSAKISKPLNANRFASVIMYIEENYHRKISLDNIADISGLSRFHVSRLFRKIFRMNFTHYITKVRLEHTRRFLLHTTQRMSDIADSCGFRDAGYFSHAFKKYYGISPQVFRSNKTHSKSKISH